MELIDRYLAAIGVLLPNRQREDITAELRDALTTQRDEQQAELGRPLTDDEEAALLRAFGHPLAVASRYGRQQYLIGPELYPLYVFVLKILLAIVAAGAVIAGVVAAAIHPGQPWSAVRVGLTALFQGAIGNVGALTAIAFALQRYNLLPRLVTEWNPKDLPKAPWGPLQRRQTWFDHVAGIVAMSLFIVWWTRALALWIPYVDYIPLKAGQRLDLVRAPIWDTLFWPVLGLAIAAIALHGFSLVAKTRRVSAHGLDLLRRLCIVFVAGIALHAGHWADVSGAGIPATALVQVDYGVNMAFQIALSVIIVIAAGLAAYDAWRLFGDKQARA